MGADMLESSSSMVRLPNRSKKGLAIDPRTGTANVGNDKDGFNSPSFFLRGASSPGLGSHLNTNEEDLRYDGEMVRKATETKLKKYWYSLLGQELYVYKKKDDEKHRGMHNLNGCFIRDDVEEFIDSTTVLYPFTLIFPGNVPRTYYHLNKESKENWMVVLKQAIGYSNLLDFYDVQETIGKGKFGLVKSAYHRKTGKRVAVKVMSKNEMQVADVELQRREIEILKMCQHPNIIRLLDLFENEDHIYIVMELLVGGDLFTYLEKRNFSIPEKRAKELAHQIATALYYLHSFGIAHRDLKPENILMESDDDEADLRIVDFGLSKIIGPNESSIDPFGTLSYVAPEVLL
jgi:serine/threonine protein kinase